MFDVLFWHNDTTLVPAALHGQLLDIFTQNLFGKPRALSILGTPIDLSEVRSDTYVVAGLTDHITPWKGVFNTARAFGGHTKFVLSSSDHLQSLINPPGNPKARYFVNLELPANPDDWLASAQAAPDYWRSHWRQWLGERSGARRNAPELLGNVRYPAGVRAPGMYLTET